MSLTKNRHFFVDNFEILLKRIPCIFVASLVLVCLFSGQAKADSAPTINATTPNSGAYTYLPHPIITSIAPNSNDTFTIFGSGFSINDKVTVNVINATVLSAADDGTSLTISALNIRPTNYNTIVVTDEYNQSSVYIYREVPLTISGITPNKGPSTGGNQVRIDGSNLINPLFSRMSTGSSGYHTCGISSGKAYCWGTNGSGQLGDGTAAKRVTPAPVRTAGTPMQGKTIVDLSEGVDYTLALASDGTVYGWGGNEHGQLGNDSYSTAYTPVAVDMSGVLRNKMVVSVMVGDFTSIVLTSDNNLYTWGYNRFGELGNGSTSDSAYPVAVNMSGSLYGKTVVEMGIGRESCLVLTSDGKLYTWGRNDYGQLGNNSYNAVYYPSPIYDSGVLNGKTIVQICAGYEHDLVLDSDGKMYSWGSNNYGQLGIGLMQNGDRGDQVSHYSTPVAVDMSGALANEKVSTMSIGYDHSIVYTTDGNVFSWGWNASGQLGDGTQINRASPVAVNMSDVLRDKTIIAVYTGGNHSVALDSFGKLYSWGDVNYTYDYWQGVRTGVYSTYNSLVPMIIDVSAIPYTLIMPTVSLGENQLQNTVLSASNDSIIGIAPPHTPGFVNVTVTNYSGQTVTLFNGYNYISTKKTIKIIYF